MRRNVPEKAVRKAVRELLIQHGFVVIPYVPGMYGQPGVSDLLCCGTVGGVPGKFVAIELKSTIGKPSEKQIAFVKQIRAAGGVAFIARSTQDVILYLGLKTLL